MTIPTLELCYVRDIHLREQKKMNFRRGNVIFTQEINETSLSIMR